MPGIGCHIREGRDVLIVTYGCNVTTTDAPVVSNEHKRAELFGVEHLNGSAA